MNTRMFGLTTGLAVMLAASSASAGQHEGHQAATADGQAAAQLAQCRQAQPGVAALIDAALKRLDEARQTNSPALMRAAADDLQSALLDVRAQLAPCAEMQVAAAAPSAPPPAAQQAVPPTQPQQPAQARPTNTPSITFRAIPSPPRGAAENEFEVMVKDSQDMPIDGAEVTLLFYMAAMPAMKMPEMRSEVKLRGAGNGRYTGKGQVMMAGPWTVTVSVRQNGREIGQQTMTITAK